MEDKLGIFFRRFTESVTDFYDIPDIVRFLMKEIERKRKIFPFWKKKVRFSYASYKKQNPPTDYENGPPKTPENIMQYFYHDDHLSKNKQILDENLNKIIPWEPEFISVQFFKTKLIDFFSFFLTEMLPFDKNSLALKQFPIPIYRDLFFDYKYEFTNTDILAFTLVKQHYRLSEKLEKIIEYLFSSLLHTFGMLLGEIIPENFQIELISGIAQTKVAKKIDFIITIRQREKILKDFFLNSHIFQFSELFYQIPLSLKNRLKMQKDLIYLLALERYYDLMPYITSVLIRIQIKCISLGHITPVLDVLNFIFSRVEDSIFETQDILGYVTVKFTRDPKKREELLKIFKFCNKNAVLFGTFQSNNRSQVQEQYRLFFLYNLQYFGEGFAKMLTSDNLLLPSVLHTRIRNLQKTHKRFPLYFILFERFLQTSFVISTNPAFKIVFNQIFKYSVDSLNEDFFSAFICSLNQRLLAEIDESNQKVTEPIEYSEIVDFLIKCIYHSIKTIFLADDPLIASKNFRDSISRYSPKNVALRTLELLFFKEIPLSDNNWMNYNLSRNKEKVISLFEEYFKIPKDYFFTNKKLLHISMKQLYSLESEFLMEDWLVDYIIEPFISFIDTIWNKIEEKNEETSLHSIATEMQQQLCRSIINPQTLDNLEVISEKLAQSFLDVFLEYSK